MKKFTKILIALGAAGIAKYIYNHVDIVTNEELEERIKKEAEVIAKEKKIKKHAETIAKKVDKITIEGAIDLDKDMLYLNKNSGHYTIGFCDHVYYDNPYNISKIYLDKDGCPQVFEFENEKDRGEALESYHTFFKDCRSRITVKDMFGIVGLIIDDYEGFKKCFTYWDPEDFIKANSENAIPNTINFGEFEK